MELILKRIAKKKTYTIGHLYANGQFVCDTLEDTDRGIDQSDPISKITSVKVYGQTAIPAGSYKINMNTVSPKFKNRAWAKPYGGKIPRLLDVPGFEGVLIHVGNKPADTLGCILVGENKVVGGLIKSTESFNKLMKLLKGSSNITISIQ